MAWQVWSTYPLSILSPFSLPSMVFTTSMAAYANAVPPYLKSCRLIILRMAPFSERYTNTLATHWTPAIAHKHSQQLARIRAHLFTRALKVTARVKPSSAAGALSCSVEWGGREGGEGVSNRFTPSRLLPAALQHSVW